MKILLVILVVNTIAVQGAYFSLGTETVPSESLRVIYIELAKASQKDIFEIFRKEIDVLLGRYVPSKAKVEPWDLVDYSLVALDDNMYTRGDLPRYMETTKGHGVYGTLFVKMCVTITDHSHVCLLRLSLDTRSSASLCR